MGGRGTLERKEEENLKERATEGEEEEAGETEGE